MISIGLVLTAVAALVHVFIFYLESLEWTSPRARRIFGVATLDDAESQKELAFNQGFYNLFLAIITAVGIAAFSMGHHAVGAALVFSGAGSMAAAATVLLLSSPDKASAALKQGVIPLLGIIMLAIGLAL
ncbi:DUF1304 domain-containing protein [Corynebacterium flavescens]|uniref:DUF1304 domain-containing protein n=1 Tax=Corynebacterium flavescens TaxID=28028 RepID=UPI002647ED7C|nr:DUF1304 domain-containing protein [Corynebacterium flavescens]MDN6198769.1 DUF1304 domain-containing protein [Corynebacterium flavescens]MDN6226767.1 DUF1304 domain-containing protein [Corynebacterium flavescens]MDN6460620.1 DUF1304 domain-containing protein [Corynebacterium flavescens]MDN6647339.1 DUF1304 domain-containing protein [Corynebacterium flavescens]